MSALPALAMKIMRALSSGRGIKLDASDLDLLATTGALTSLFEHAAHAQNPFDFPTSDQERCRTCDDCLASLPFAYFIQVGERGPIKIGLAKNVEQRRTELQTAHSEQLHIRAATKSHVERHLHQFYRSEHIRGEWHRPSPRMLAFIGSIAHG